MTPIVDRLETQYGPQLTVQRVNANEGDGPAIMRAYIVRGHPTVLILNQAGQEVDRLIGPQPAEKLVEAVERVLTSSTNQNGE